MKVLRIYGDRQGDTYERTYDLTRLNAQAIRVYAVMADGDWHTLPEVAKLTGDGEPSVSARIRDLRKEQFGGHEVERRSRGERGLGLFEYRLILNEESALA